MITSLKHPLVKHLVKLRESSEYRTEQKRVVIQGRKMVEEIIQCAPVFHVVATEPHPQIPADKMVLATEAVLNKISGVVASEGIAAEVEMPSWGILESFNRILALDAVSDPGNLGTLLRTALAFGWKGVYLLPGCCDPYNDKALRAAMGATFKVKMDRGTAEQLQLLCAPNHWQALVADLHGQEPSHTPGKVLLVLGNEARGPSSAIRAFCKPVTVPMEGDIESLNVAIAGALLMYLLK